MKANNFGSIPLLLLTSSSLVQARLNSSPDINRDGLRKLDQDIIIPDECGGCLVGNGQCKKQDGTCVQLPAQDLASEGCPAGFFRCTGDANVDNLGMKMASMEEQLNLLDRNLGSLEGKVQSNDSFNFRRVKGARRAYVEGRWFFVFTSPLIRNQAKVVCEANDLVLAIVDSQVQSDAIMNLIGDDRHQRAYIGAGDYAHEGTAKNEDGSPLKFQPNWYQNKNTVDVHAESFDCVSIAGRETYRGYVSSGQVGGKWELEYCDRFPQYYACSTK